MVITVEENSWVFVTDQIIEGMASIKVRPAKQLSGGWLKPIGIGRSVTVSDCFPLILSPFFGI